MKLKHFPGLLLHFLFLILTLTGISLLYFHSDFGQGLGWLQAGSYEDSEAFVEQMENDITSVFDYVFYRDIFETNGTVDFSKPMVTISNDVDTRETFSLDFLIRYARNNGYYLDDNFHILGTPTENPSEKTYYVEWKSYAPDEQYNEPGEAYQTLSHVAYEVLEKLSAYYIACNSLLSGHSNFLFSINYRSDAGETRLYTNAPDIPASDLKGLGRYAEVTGDSAIIENNLRRVPGNLATGMEQCNPFPDGTYYAVVSVDTSYPRGDVYFNTSSSYKMTYRYYVIGLILLGCGFLGCMVTFFQLALLSKNSRIFYIDRLSLESCLLIFVCLYFVFLFLLNQFLTPLLHLLIHMNYWTYSTQIARLVFLYLLILTFLLGICRRFYRHTLADSLLIKKWYRNFCTSMRLCSFRFRMFLSYIAFFVFNIFAVTAGILLFQQGTGKNRFMVSGIVFFILLLADLTMFYRVIHQAGEQDSISEALENLAKGKTDYQVDLHGFDGKELTVAQNINHISSGLEQALQEQVKSERLKSDLITNVSHDIKTPLTSIINYVDLMKREKIENKKVQEYLDILDQKSQRLKNLTEDLVEASKASSGNISLNITTIDLGELVQQTTGEFEERFSIRHLELVTEIAHDCLKIKADGRRLWRVLENLYNNAFKYALEQTRVYVSVCREGEQVLFTIKNVSERPLNFDPEELTERFVRGDVSRTTEGSGLGLSIAKDLTLLQGGTFNIFIDGDLFKVTIGMPTGQGDGSFVPPVI